MRRRTTAPLERNAVSLILVTGASTGLGLAAASALSLQGHQVVVHARSPQRLPEGGWHAGIVGDLATLDGMRAVAASANALGRFDAVIHNAGVLGTPDAVHVNVVAPYVLTALIPVPRRLVYLSSSMHRGGGTDLGGLERADASYSDTKLWVTALSLALAARWPEASIHSVDPGWVPTRMGGSGAPDDLEQGHLTQTWLATHDPDAPRTGGYWHHRRSQSPARAAADPQFQDALLAALELRTGVALP